MIGGQDFRVDCLSAESTMADLRSATWYGRPTTTGNPSKIE